MATINSKYLLDISQRIIWSMLMLWIGFCLAKYLYNNKNINHVEVNKLDKPVTFKAYGRMDTNEEWKLLYSGTLGDVKSPIPIYPYNTCILDSDTTWNKINTNK